MTTSTSQINENYWLCPLYLIDVKAAITKLGKNVQIKAAPIKLVEYIYQKTMHQYGQWADLSDFKWSLFINSVNLELQEVNG
jgi:hypothetical protein